MMCGKHLFLLLALLAAFSTPVQNAATQTAPVSVNEVRQRAEQGDPAAQFDLGIRYKQGQDVPADPMLAADWFRKAAAQSNTDAMVQLGIMYGIGRGVPKDLQQAVSWFRVAAELGHASAQFNLGGMYARGEGVTQDFIEAYKWQSLAITRASDRPDVPTFAASRDAIGGQLTPDQVSEANARIREWLDEFGKKK
jgi:TPR repeat protein